MSDEPSYYMAIVRPENLQTLEEAGLHFYTVKDRNTRIKRGDRIVLYRSRGAPARHGGPGVVGTFEVIADPSVQKRASGEPIFYSLYPTRIPWRAIAMCLRKPLPIAPLVPELSMFTNKQRYGSALQASMKRLARADYDILESALKQHVATT
jgi:predicted RNA-binding protein